MEEIILNAQQYQALLMMLPNPSIHRSSHALPTVRLAIPIPHGRSMYIQERGQEPVQMMQIREIEFEMVFDRPIPYWQPVKRVIITPVKKEY